MEIESLDQGIIEKEPINKPIHICFTSLEYERWFMIKKRLRAINPKLKIQEFGRLAIREAMDKLERLIITQETSSEIIFPEIPEDVTGHID